MSAPGAQKTTTQAARSVRAGKTRWGRKNPYPARIVANTVLSGPSSEKEVRHLVISLGDSGIDYEPGDGISIAPVNNPELVDALLARLGATGEEIITDRRSECSLRTALTHNYEISTPSRYLVDFLAARVDDPELTAVAASEDASVVEEWLRGRDVLDLLNIDPTLTLTPEELLDELRPLAHRVYSISSSPSLHAGTAHITMSTVRYQAGDRTRGGVCSTYLADRRTAGDEVGVFITPNKAFRLPADDAAVIMIGPGTGVAPFRAFLHERAARGATGLNWLFFGDQRRDADYLYAEELESFLDDGLLNRLDLAFSRDQEHKIYVQDRMREQGAELWSWLLRGASVYVCGDSGRMAADVDAALHAIAVEHGGLDDAAATEFFDALRTDKRYQRDVY